jgi:branched-chain amino acid transport system permease protein
MMAWRSVLLVVAGFAALPLLAPALVGAGIFAGHNTLYNLMVFVLIITLAAQGWNIAGGYGGQFSFGHAAFFGAGAYAQALMP